MTQEEILLATLTTDSNGECTYTYTGTGAGKIDLKAKYRSLQSEIYALLDTLFKDMGTSSDYNTTGWNNARITLSRNTETTLIWDTTSNNGLYYRNFTIENGICIEFDINFNKNSGNSQFIEIYNTWTSLQKVTKYNSNLEYDTWTHIKIEMMGSTGRITNDKNDTILTFDCSNANRFAFYVQHSEDVIQYKNFVIYSL